MTEILRVTDLHVSAGASDNPTPILKGISFGVKKGRVLAIVGESGSGKSMTAHSIIQLLPDGVSFKSGSIVLNPDEQPLDITGLKRYGKDMRRVRSRRIGMVFQDSMSALNPVHTVGNQVAEALRENRRRSRSQAKIEVLEIFEHLGIPEPEERFNSYPHQFSGGMRQRVMIAIALIRAPELVIADEPTTALDMTIQKQVMHVFTSLARRLEISIILITHNMGLVAQYSSEVAVMHKGEIVEHGSTYGVMNSPQHPYTRALIASVPTLDMDPEVPLSTVADFMDSTAETGA